MTAEHSTVTELTERLDLVFADADKLPGLGMVLAAHMCAREIVKGSRGPLEAAVNITRIHDFIRSFTFTIGTGIVPDEKPEWPTSEHLQ